MLQALGGYECGEVEVPEVHLSQRGAYDANGYYHCVSKVALT